MVKLDFFTEINSKDCDEIKKMVKTLDKKKCTYKVYEINQNNINGRSLPILKLTLETGDILEYDKDKMLSVIVGLSKAGIPK